MRKSIKKLTKKENGFVKDYIETGIGSLAVKNNYDVSTDESARAIAHENLTKPHIIEAIADRLPDDLLAKRHLELLNKREVVTMFNGEGILIDQPDTQAVSKGLDMAYKVKGTYAPEKRVNANINYSPETKQRTKELIAKFDEELKAQLLQDDDNDSGAMDTRTPATE